MSAFLRALLSNESSIFTTDWLAGTALEGSAVAADLAAAQAAVVTASEELIPVGILFANPNNEDLCIENATYGTYCSVTEECASACHHWEASNGSETEKIVAQVKCIFILAAFTPLRITGRKAPLGGGGCVRGGGRMVSDFVCARLSDTHVYVRGRRGT